MNFLYELQMGYGAFQPIGIGIKYGFSRFAGGLQRFQAARKARRSRVRDLRTLQDLSDRDLRDLGLSRYDVRAILDGTYRR